MKSSNKRILKRRQKRDTKFMKTAFHGLHFDIQAIIEFTVLLIQAHEQNDTAVRDECIGMLKDITDKYKDMLKTDEETTTP